jgi:hypothetical protein
MSDALVLPVILRTGVVRLGPERFEIEWRAFFFGKEKTKALPLAWWRLFRGYDMARPKAPKSTLSYAQVRYADGNARLEYGEAVERQGSGSRHAVPFE